MSNYTLIKCGKLFDGIKAELQENVEIVDKDNKIEEVGKNLSVPNNVNVIDLSSVTVTPGLIDVHVHFQHFYWKERRNEIVFHNASW